MVLFGVLTIIAITGIIVLVFVMPVSQLVRERQKEGKNKITFIVGFFPFYRPHVVV